MPIELSTRRLHSRDDKWRHRRGMSCTCPGRLEVSRGIVEAKHVTSDRHKGSAVCLTNTNSCQLNSTHMTPTNCSRITSRTSRCIRHAVYARYVPRVMFIPWILNSSHTENYLRKSALNWNIFSWSFVWKQDIGRFIVNWAKIYWGDSLTLVEHQNFVSYYDECRSEQYGTLAYRSLISLSNNCVWEIPLLQDKINRPCWWPSRNMNINCRPAMIVWKLMLILKHK